MERRVLLLRSEKMKARPMGDRHTDSGRLVIAKTYMIIRGQRS